MAVPRVPSAEPSDPGHGGLRERGGAAATAGAFSPLELEILWRRLETVMDEVDGIIVRTTFSTILSEGRDFACILTDRECRSLCQSQWSTATFTKVYPRTARLLLEHFPAHTLREGDVLATNDPWLGTGHLPDYVLLSPVFWRGELVACIGTVSHMSDVGGHAAEIESDDVYSEGLRMPPFKLYEAGVENALAFSVMGANCRVPDLLLGDLRAMAGAARIGAQRIVALLEQTRIDLNELAEEILSRSETLMRRRIAALPDGTYGYTLDIDGYGDPVRLQVAVEIAGSDVYVDYTGTSAVRRHAAINVPFSATYASSMYPFKCAFAAEVPNNSGLFEPIHVSAPEGCILNATFPSPVKARAKTTNNINQVLFGALWPLMGDRVQASGGGIWPMVLMGEDPACGSFLVDLLPHGGRGALPRLDGMVPISYPENSTITPCEVLEAQAPILFHRKELRVDSGGAGRHRGGLGQVITFEHVGSEPMVFNLTPDRITTRPQGLAGGEPGTPGKAYLNGTELEAFPPIELVPGDVVSLHLGGGGGFGPPKERSPEDIERDRRLGYVTKP
jgi:N-methylhydantoinase B